jgi:hypothetical protein
MILGHGYCTYVTIGNTGNQGYNKNYLKDLQ